jgi:hypothetical protein
MITFSLPNLDAFLKDFEKRTKTPVSSEVLDKLAKKIKEIMIKRTKSGRDVNGKDFKPYSKNYAEKKRKTLVNLTDTGLMLDSIKIERADKQRTFYFSAREDVAEKHQYGVTPMPRREFFGFGQRIEEQTQLKQFWEEEVRKRVQQS